MAASLSLVGENSTSSFVTFEYNKFFLLKLHPAIVDTLSQCHYLFVGNSNDDSGMYFFCSSSLVLFGITQSMAWTVLEKISSLVWTC
jgi:hypothetical protein